MILPEAPSSAMLLVRTDYSNDEAWRAVLSAATALYEEEGYPRMGASLQPVESAELAGLTPHDLVRTERAGYLSALAVADEQSMRDLSVLFVDLNEYNEHVGRTFRAIPEEVEAIVTNLSIANMDFFEFADSVEADGIFRGFRR